MIASVLAVITTKEHLIRAQNCNQSPGMQALNCLPKTNSQFIFLEKNKRQIFSLLALPLACILQSALQRGEDYTISKLRINLKGLVSRKSPSLWVPSQTCDLPTALGIMHKHCTNQPPREIYFQILCVFMYKGQIQLNTLKNAIRKIWGRKGRRLHSADNVSQRPLTLEGKMYESSPCPQPLTLSTDLLLYL